MNLHRADEYPHPPRGQVFRQSRLAQSAVPIVLWACTAWFIVAPLRLGWPTLFYIAAGLCGLLALLTLSNLRGAWSRRNWTIVLADRGVWLNVRSFGNAHFDGRDTTVAFIPYAEIEGVRGYTERLSAPTSDSEVTWTHRALDVRVRCDTGPLELACHDELARKGPERGKGITWRSRSNHVPMRVPEPGLVRVTFSGESDRVRPSLKRALAAFGQRVKIEDPIKLDRTDHDSLDDEAFAAMVIERCERGQKIKAVAFIRNRYGYSLKEAMRFVDELVDSNQAEHPSDDEAFAAMIIEQCERGQKIKAVALTRKRYGYSLREAKRFVDELMDAH